MREQSLDIKGLNIIGVFAALERQCGRGAREDVQRLLPEDFRRAVDNREIIASAWYPLAWYTAMLPIIVEVTGGTESLVREISREAVNHDYKTIFRVVRMFLRPSLALQQAVRVNRRYLTGGQIEVFDADHDFIHYRFHSFHGFTRLMWRDYIGGIEGVLMTLGVKNFSPRILDGGEDDDHHMEIVVRWTV